MLKRARNVFWLACRDFHNEWQMSVFFILALAAVLGPMMILFGLKFGIIGPSTAARASTKKPDICHSL